MADRNMLLRAMALAAKKVSNEKDNGDFGDTPLEVLESIIVGRFTSEITDGKTVISTQEGGGGVSFSIVQELSPADVIALAMECSARITSGEYGDPDSLPNVMPKRVIKRLRVSFAKAVTS